MRAGYRSLFFLLCAGASLVGAGEVRAHEAPDRDTNNRYLKLTPLRDQIRLAYVVYFGETPGAAARRRMDHDGDGALSDAEGDAFAADIAAMVRDNLSVTETGAARPVRWTEFDLGLGARTTRGGSFSVDLIGWVCLAPAPVHHLRLRDRVRLSAPGETELRFELGPGVSLVDAPAELGPHTAPTDGAPALRWHGAADTLAEPGVEFGFEVAPGASRASPGSPCGPDATSPQSSAWPPLGVVAGGLVIAAAVALAISGYTRRRRRAR
ncbi:hypothetical protein [Haliangium sp.]|uniref:hypothetical protein n=1 Tax=Haliangium sp. TaxID=2663208 RepID=UPI003D0BBDE2